MKSLQEGSKKIQQICELLKKDALEPAKKEAEAHITEAKAKAQKIIEDAQKHADSLLKDAKASIEQEKSVFQSFMSQAARQAIETLKQQIEQKFFNAELQKQISVQASDPKVISKLIDAIIKAIEKEGLSSDFSVIIPQAVSAKEVNAFLGENILNKLKDHTVNLGPISAGVQVKLHNKNMTIDISDAALVDILNTYRKGFRELFFQK
jgi:V/A-type H+/Na+-transporting ATPase subunit E